MTLTESQVDNVYKILLAKLSARIVQQHGTQAKFAAEKGFNRTSLVKQFSENIKQEMSIGMYFRLASALDILDSAGLSEFERECSIPLKTYLRINNNAVMQSLTLIANDL